MASKRQKKKKEVKQKKQSYEKLGYSKKQTKTITNKKSKQSDIQRMLERSGYTKKAAAKLSKSISDVGAHKKEKKYQDKSRKTARDRMRRYNAAKVEGFTSKEAQTLASSQRKYEEALLERRGEYEREHTPIWLLTFYKDKTENTDGEMLYDMKQRSKRRKTKDTIQSIQGWLEMTSNFGYIGQAIVQVTDNPNSLKRYYSQFGYLNSYEGQGKNLKPLLDEIERMMVLLYTLDDKDEFILDLIKNLRLLPFKKAQENADYIEVNFTRSRNVAFF